MLDTPAFWQLFCEYEGVPLRLDGWQVAFLRRRARYRALEKAVQIGFSFVCAMDALHMALMYEDETSTFISVNESDAHEKVLYARKLYDGLDPEIRRYIPLSKDSTEELWLGPRERPARLLTRPATSGLRGPATHVYLDEIDHYRPGQDAEVFTAAMGRVTRRYRRLTVGSSVFGEDTVLSRLMSRDQFPDFLKFRVPWWACEQPDVRAGIEAQRRNMAPEDFEQEYECRRGDTADSAFPQNLIRRCWHDLVPTDAASLDPGGTFVAGYDPGGSRHPAVLTILEAQGRWVQRVQRAKRGEPLAEQEAMLDGILGQLPGLRLAIDEAGVGMQMAQALEKRWGSRRVIRVKFTEATRNEMTLGLQRCMQTDTLAIVRDPELAHQLNRTRRLPGGRIEQLGSDRRHHYDKFWSLAMAAALIVGRRSVYEDRGLLVVDLDEEERQLARTWTIDEGPYIR